MINDMKYSVLMSVYYKEKPRNLKESLDSMFNQTIEPNEIILVRDGLLTKELEVIIDSYFHKHKNFHVYTLEKNSGLGVALNYGLKHCNNEIIVRMDTDDISLSDRVEKQLKYLNVHKNISVIGSYVEEFLDEDYKNLYIKCVPLEDKKIKEMFKKKNAMNHPSVVFKKSAVKSVNGYIELNLNEDYFLWVRMAEKGFMFANIDEPLVRMRISDETYLRRGGLKYFLTQNSIYKYMKESSYINFKEYVLGYLVRIVFRVLLPNNVRKQVYTRLLRKGI
jgi:glycosyltransferase involved in cell wall biosynthesis